MKSPNQPRPSLPAPSALLCDYMPRPDQALITNAQPVFSWIFNTHRPNQYQYAYRILVASSKEMINQNIGDVWDTGQVVSDESVCVRYGGKSLESQKSYWWKVQVWSDPDEASAWSCVQHIITGDYSYQRKWPYESRLVKVVEQDGIGYHCFENRAPLIYHEKHPVKIVKHSADSCFVDFGKSAFGTLKIKLGKLVGSQIRVCIGEKSTGDAVDRNPGGSLTFWEQSFDIDPSCEEFILDLPRFVPRYPHSLSLPDFMKDVKPFRYCEISGLSELGTEDIVQLALYLEFNEQDASFHSSDANLNAVYDLCKYSIMVNTFNGDYASSERERMMYEADTYIHQLGHYATERQYATARYSGLFQLYHASWPTEWIYHAIFIAHADFLVTNDKAFLAAAYKDLQCKLMLPMADENLLISTRNKLQTKEFLDSIYYNKEKLEDIVDWPPADFSGGKYGERDNFVFTDYNSVVNAFHYKSLLLMKEIAMVVGKNDDADFYGELAMRFRPAFNQAFFDTARGVYLDGINPDHSSLHANLFALAFGLVDPANVKSVVDFIKSRGMACSVYAAQYLLEGLYDAGEAQYALELMTATHDRSWMNMLYTGSTITTEAWDLKYKHNGSWTHAWSTSPVNVIPRKLVGIEPLDSGFKTLRIFPQIGNLEKVSMKYPTPRGSVAVDILQAQDEFSLKLTIPGNSTAMIYIPKMNKGKVETNDEENVIRQPDTSPGYFIYRVGSGTYQFLSR